MAGWPDEARTLLLETIGHWVLLQPRESADARMAELKAGLDELHFAWNGPQEASEEGNPLFPHPGAHADHRVFDRRRHRRGRPALPLDLPGPDQRIRDGRSALGAAGVSQTFSGVRFCGYSVHRFSRPSHGASEPKMVG